MPGIVVGIGGAPLDGVHAASRQLAHVPWHATNAVGILPQLALGWSGFPQSFDAKSSSAGAGHDVHVWRYGHMFRAGPAPHAVAADEILRDYLDGGVDACCNYEGSFVVAIVDTRTQRLYIVPDRLCTQPVYYAVDGPRVAVGPEVKALATVLGRTPMLSREGVIGFLTAGYNIGRQTLFAGIERLELGKLLEISWAAWPRLTARRFWKLDFAAADKIVKRGDAEDALFAAIEEGHRILFSDSPQFQILLSGGADSRGMLGTCSLLGSLPAKAVTWGLLQDVPRSDASIAQALAARFGVPWEFIATTTDGFVDNCADWAYVSELSNDNFGWYTEGFGTLHYMHATGYPCSFIGDESWGCQGFAHGELHAYGRVLTPSVPSSVLSLLQPSVRAHAAEAYFENIRATMRDCEDVDWSDRKDFLYLHGRVARYIFALGYNRGHATEHRRPFLTRAVLDVVRRLPAAFRVNKNLYRTMLRRHLPDAARVPSASVNSLPDWSFDLRMREPLRSCFLGLLNEPLIESGALGELFDVRAFAAVRDAFFAQTPTPVSRKPRAASVIKGHLNRMLWASRAYEPIDRWRHRWRGNAPTQRATVLPVDLLRRAAILVLLERQLPRFNASAAGARDARHAVAGRR
jgi:hypothetical protein